MIYVLFVACLCISAIHVKSQSFNIEVLDKTSPNTKVFDLDRHYSDQKMTHMLLSDNKVRKYFEIKNEKLYTKSTIDMDTMCSMIGECCFKENDFCFQKLTIFSSSSQSSMTNRMVLNVNFRDINDHSPQFLSSSKDIRLSESTKDPYSIILPLAQDEDFGNNRIQTYQIGSKEPTTFDDYFTLIVNKDTPVPSQVSLRLKRLLDRETISLFSFELLAIDGGTDLRKTGSISINIKISDENDNKPIFQKTLYKEMIKEGLFNDRPVVTLSATDIDEEENAKIIYQLSPRYINDDSITDTFRIESDGKIYLKRALDYEKKKEYKFTITATNPTPFANDRMTTSTATVEIAVDNFHDEPLEIIIDYPDGKNWSKIMENRNSVFIAYVTTRSSESGQKNFGVICKLKTFEKFFELTEKSNDDSNSKAFEIKTIEGIDREQYPRIDTSISCRESSSTQGQHSEAPLVVIIADENDNSPILSVEGKKIVKENERVGSVIFVVKAKDPDEGENGMVSFSLDKSGSVSLEYLAIGDRDGKVRVIKNIDCEASSDLITYLDIVVTASDHGKPPKYTDLMIRIEVQDVNDNEPIILGLPLKFQINENNAKNSLIGEIEVQDRDHSDKVSIRIENYNKKYLPFTITTKDNKRFFLNSTQSFDCEKDPEFVFKIIASDGTSGFAHSITTNVEVLIVDVNDNAPTIIFPTQNNASVHRISYLEPQYYKLLLVSANDQDRMPENNRLQYNVEDDSKIFFINNDEKFIATVREMAKADLGEHKIRIVVKDSGHPPLEASVIINIVIDQTVPKSGSSRTNERSNTAYNDRSLDSHPDAILYVTVIIILLIVIIIVSIIVYFLRNCKKERNCLQRSLFTCCQSTTPSVTVSKLMISSPKMEYDENKQLYNKHQNQLMNNEIFTDQHIHGESYIPENIQASGFNMVNNPYMSSRTTYTKLANNHHMYPTHHIYQTIEDGRLEQRQGDLNMKQISSHQPRGMGGCQYKSELNINRYNLLDNEVFPPNNTQRAPWMTSQTPLLSRSPNIINNILSADSTDNFAVAFPIDQSTFV